MATKLAFNVDQYYEMAESGIIGEDERVELIEGEIVKMSPIGVRHASCVNRLVSLFGQAFGKKIILGIQNPIRLSAYSEPQPDIALLKPKADFYADAHPSPADILLIVEVADTSIGYDRETKVPLYARAGIPEMWLVDLVAENVSVYSGPVRGEYTQAKQLKRDEHVVASVFRDFVVPVDDILGPAR